MAVTTLTDYVTVTKADFFYFKKNIVIDTLDGFELISHSIIEPYINILKGNAIEITLSDEEIEMYKYKPRLLSQVVYGTENLYWLLLFLNGMTVEEFVPKNIFVLTSTNRTFVESIINKEISQGTITGVIE